jgi:hypothetical protein
LGEKNNVLSEKKQAKMYGLEDKRTGLYGIFVSNDRSATMAFSIWGERSRI